MDIVVYRFHAYSLECLTISLTETSLTINKDKMKRILKLLSWSAVTGKDSGRRCSPAGK